MMRNTSSRCAVRRFPDGAWFTRSWTAVFDNPSLPQQRAPRSGVPHLGHFSDEQGVPLVCGCVCPQLGQRHTLVPPSSRPPDPPPLPKPKPLPILLNTSMSTSFPASTPGAPVSPPSPACTHAAHSAMRLSQGLLSTFQPLPGHVRQEDQGHRRRPSYGLKQAWCSRPRHWCRRQYLDLWVPGRRHRINTLNGTLRTDGQTGATSSAQPFVNLGDTAFQRDCMLRTGGDTRAATSTPRFIYLDHGVTPLTFLPFHDQRNPCSWPHDVQLASLDAGIDTPSGWRQALGRPRMSPNRPRVLAASLRWNSPTTYHSALTSKPRCSKNRRRYLPMGITSSMPVWGPE
jgi:hypothetical protein